MEEESFTQSLYDTPDDLAADGTLTVMRTEDFGEWYRRVQAAYNREYSAMHNGSGVDSMTDAQLAEHGLVRLPTDADGVPIHVGDVMEWCDSGETLTVEGIGRDVLFYIDGGNAEWTAARNKRHRHEPTVEDVLREFADRVCNSGHQWGLDAADTIAATAAKLRLAEGVE